MSVFVGKLRKHHNNFKINILYPNLCYNEIGLVLYLKNGTYQLQSWWISIYRVIPMF